MNRLSWLERAIAAVLVVAPAFVAPPAGAACHIADFTEHDVLVEEDDRRVTLTVHLVGGQPTCAGTVLYETVEGTADARTTTRAPTAC